MEDGGGGGGEANSAHPQIVFFITSIRNATEPNNLVIFLKLNVEYDFQYKNEKFLP